MKDKILYIIAAVLCITGAMLIFGGAIHSDFSFSEMTGHAMTEEIYEISPDVTEIIIDDKDADIYIVSSLKENITVTTNCEEGTRYDQYSSDNNGKKTCVFEKINEQEWYNYIFNINFTVPSIKIEIPEGRECEFDLANSNGNIMIERVRAKSVACETEGGYVHISGAEIAGELYVRSSYGSVDLYSTKVGEAVDITTDGASISLNIVEAETVSTVAWGDSLHLGNVEAVKDIVGKAEYYIHFSGCDYGGKMSLTNVNGDVEGTLLGSREDYSYKTSAPEGLNTLPKDLELGEKELEIITHNGVISVTFETGAVAETADEFWDESDIITEEEIAETDALHDETDTADIPEPIIPDETDLSFDELSVMM